MARTTVPINVLSSGGATVGAGTGETTGDPANDHDFDNNGDVIIIVRNNDGAAPHTVTWQSPLVLDGTAVAGVNVNVGASATQIFGPFPVRLYNQDNGRVNVDVDSALLFLKAYRLPVVQ